MVKIKAADYDYLSSTWASLTLIILFSEMLKNSKIIISTFLNFFIKNNPEEKSDGI